MKGYYMTFKIPSLFKKFNNDLEKWTNEWSSTWVDFDRSFEEFERMFPTSVRTSTFPPCDIEKTDEGYVLSLAVAGFKKDDLEVSIASSNILVVKGSKESTLTPSGSSPTYIAKGIGVRNFTRKWQLNVGDDITNVALSDGLLTITIKRPQTPEVQSKTLDIKEGA